MRVISRVLLKALLLELSLTILAFISCQSDFEASKAMSRMLVFTHTHVRTRRHLNTATFIRKAESKLKFFIVLLHKLEN